MFLWLDDIRPMPDVADVHCKSAVSAWIVIKKERVDHISFDHDLGDDTLTGYWLARKIEEAAYRNEIEPMSWSIHSANPVGRENIRRAMEQADRYWRMHFDREVREVHVWAQENEGE